MRMLALFVTLAAGVLPAVAAPNGLAALLTDYGADSIYVGVLKGAMLSKNPQVRIETVTNSIPNYDIAAGAYILAEAAKQWPAGTAFCCVVDPGVGTRRKSIAIATENGQYFVGPDNGLLSLAAARFGVASVYELSNAKYFGPNALSSTFQGRDIYGPVTAAIAGGAPLDDLGPALDKESIVKLDFPEAREDSGVIHGAVIRADGYGNLVTNIPAALMEQAGIQKGDTVDVTIGSEHFTAPYQNTYADVPEGTRLLCAQSIGMVEAAINKGDLAATIAQGLHAEVVLQKAGADNAADASNSEGTLYFSQSGGIAGIQDEVTLHANGRCQLQTRRHIQSSNSSSSTGGTITIGVDAGEARRIIGLAREAFAAPPPAPGGPQAGGADYLTYVVRLDGQEKTFNDLNTPRAFKAVTRALHELLAQHAPKGK